MASKKRAALRVQDFPAHAEVGIDAHANGIPAPRNQLLGALTPDAYARLAPELELVPLRSGDVLYEPHAPLEHLYFPDSCVASMVRRMNDGSGVEVGTIGFEGIVGISAVLGARTMPTQCIIQIAGSAWRVATHALLAAVRRPTMLATDGRSFSTLLHLYSQAFFEQVAQSAACNRMHSLEQRCARWLLMTHDRAIGDELALTQEFLSYMLGVRRAGVTEAAGSLQRSGLINYRHGRIRIRDRSGLEASACECYEVGVRAYALLLNLPDAA